MSKANPSVPERLDNPELARDIRALAMRERQQDARPRERAAAVYCHHLAGQDQAAIARLEAFVDTPMSAAPPTGTLVSLAERRARGGR